MIDGALSKAIVYGALVLTGLIIIGNFILRAIDSSYMPSQTMITALTTLIGFLFGTTVRPPTGVHTQDFDTIKDKDSVYTHKE